MRFREHKLLSHLVAIISGVLLLSSIFYLLSSIPHAYALEVGVSEVDETIALTGTDIRVIIARIIRVALGLLGIIAVGFILYGGFVWMTAGGQEDKVTTAKRILTNAVIGLVIILTSFAITQFVLSRLIEATTGVRLGVEDGVGGIPGGLPAGAFVVRSVSPQNPAPPQGFPMNSPVRIRLNQTVDEATVAANVVVRPSDVEAAVTGTFDVQGSLIRFVPEGSCAPFEGSNCFASNTTFTVTVGSGLRSTGGRLITCGGLAPNCTAEFSIGAYIDTEDPLVSLMVPTPQQSVPQDFLTLRARATDDSAISEVEFFDEGISVGTDGPLQSIATFEASTIWETGALALNYCHNINASATDIAENTTSTSAVPVVVRAFHCFNGVQDAGETGVDCGGDLQNNYNDYCGRCAGAACGPGAEEGEDGGEGEMASPVSACAAFCRSAACVGGVCVDLPRIDDFSPRNAGPGSLVTITGEFFGTSGTVTFLGLDGPEDDVVAEVASCEGAWTTTQVVVQVSEGVVNGPVAITTAVGTDTTADDRGFVDNFSPEGLVRPGLCPIIPPEGAIDAQVTLRGTGFGEDQLDSVVMVEDRELRVIEFWDTEEIRGRVPAVASGRRSVRVIVSGQESNAVMFTVIGPEAGALPFISAVLPNAGPSGTYLTISGTNFGEVGQVIFRNPATGATAIGDTDFPEACAGVFWGQNEITVKVPGAYSSGVGSDGSDALERVPHELIVRRSGVNEAESNAVSFRVTDDTPAPGLCGLLPVSGPATTLVRFFGERFGSISNTVARFFEDQEAAPTFVESEEVRARVPDQASTGPVEVVVATASAPSNPRNFQVADCRVEGATCGAGLECCANGSCMPDGSCGEEITTGGYAWYLSTGPIPRVPRLVFACGANVVPSPAPYSVRARGEDVCINALITARFSIPMDVGTINLGNVELRSCTGSPPDLVCTPVGGTVLTPFLWSGNGVLGGHGLTLRPGALLTDTWYEVVLGTGIRGRESDGGIALEEDLDCGPGLAYCWQFKTRETEELCALDDISIEPFEYTATAAGALGRVVYTAFGRTDDDICLVLDTRPYDFDWTADAPLGYATIAPGIPEDLPGFVASAEDDQAVATPVLETPVDNPVDVRTVASADGNTLASGAAFLTIDYTDPEVVEWAPNCTAACINASIWLRFNTDMRDAPLAYSVLNPAVLELWQCPNESCLSPVTMVPLTSQALNTAAVLGIPPGHILTVDPEGDLEPNTYYRWILRGFVQSRSGVSLVGENFGPDYSQIFRTKNDATPCVISSVELAPSRAVVSVVGARVPFNATPRGFPDECSSYGQILVAREYNWSWGVRDANVAQYLVGGAPRDTSVAIGPACSSQCLNTGAAGVFGAVAVCGNGSACTLDVECATGEVCSRGECIEATLGEECDDGNITDGDGCSRICLREGGRSGPTLLSGPNLLSQLADLPNLYNYVSGDGDPDPQYIRSNTDAVSGSLSLEIHSGTVFNSGGTYGGSTADVRLAGQEAGRRYAISYLMKNISGGPATIMVSHQTGAGDNSTLSHRVSPSDQWLRYTFVATLDEPKNLLYLWSDEPDRTWLVDDLRLVEVALTTPVGLATSAPTVGVGCGNGGACATNADCNLAIGERCDAASRTCVEISEDCDDGNTVSGDGCSSSCINEGARPSALGGTTCGNGVIDLGEDCDDGNSVSRDGCSAQCLREGSRSGPLSICGNGDVEAGEECDGGAGCDRLTCLHTGTVACVPSLPVGTPCCGNGGSPEAGEDCDDGEVENGDGCSARCLFEGASPFYEEPSFCGDGDMGAGEECEAAGGDGKIDPFQVAEAVGRATVTDGAQSTTLTAGTSTFTDDASFTLQCGFTSDNQCRHPVLGIPTPTLYGVGSDSCCYSRPWLLRTVPSHGSQNVCRNSLIRVEFPQRMDLGSFSGHVLIARAAADPPTAADTCAPGEEEMTRTLPPPPAGVPLARALGPFAHLGEWIQSFYKPFVAIAAPPPVPAIPWFQPAGLGAWCLGSVTGRVSGVHHENNPNTSTDDHSSLIFTLENRALDSSTWYRVRIVGEAAVGDDIIHGVRSANGVGLRANFEFSFRTGTDICTVSQVVVSDESGAALFTQADEEHPFEAVAYSNRGGQLDSIVPVPGVYDWVWGTWTSAASSIVTVSGQAAGSVNPNTATIRADGRNGTTTVSTSLAINADALSSQSTAGRTVSGNKPVEVFLCENLGLEVADVPDNAAGLPSPYGNFRTRYCRDAGSPGVSEDLPMMRVQTVPQPPGVIFKEFLLQYVNPAAEGDDAIGFRILPNPSHFSAARWYASQGFAGSPQALTVDGYDAVRDDRTVYIHAANLNPDDGLIYDNIYVVSVNEGAQPEAVNIFEQLIANLVFNQNLIEMSINLCVPGTGLTPTSCGSDFDCSGGATCQAPKNKIRRDTRRLADLRDMEAVFSRRCTGGNCSYPVLSGGTFVRAVSTSLWPSWLETLSTELQTILPTDPLNHFADCPTGYDDATCFASAAASGCPNGSCYQCPQGSHIYEYTSRAPDEYRLATDLEYTDSLWATPIAAFPASDGATLIAGQGVTYCQGNVVGSSNVCGDGIVDPITEACERGETGVRACTTPSGPGRIASICNDTCTDFIDQPSAICIAEFCGDGVVQGGEVCDDGDNNGFYGFCDNSCSGVAAYCGDGALAGIEQCDLGAANGQWNRTSGTLAAPLTCAWDCSFPGPYCGDSELNGTESCDGQDLRGPGRCSNDAEQPCAVDSDCPVGGNCATFCTTRKRCSSNVILTCSTLGASCDSGQGVCTEYPREYRRPCDMTGADSCTWDPRTGCQIIGTGCGDGIVRGTEQCEDSNEVNTDACTNVCRFNVCGDGLLWEGVEQCDAGTANGVPCVAPYGGTCNYCSPTCTFVTQTGGFCGDSVITDDELCDGSADPIVRTPAPTGYVAGVSFCNSSPVEGLAACHALCPPIFNRASVRFQEDHDDNPSPSTSYTFEDSETDVNQLAIPACRIGGNLTVNTAFGSDVIHFPSPLDVLFVLDNSASMLVADVECDAGTPGGDASNEYRVTCLKRALCGINNCSSLTPQGAIVRLLESRDPGDVRIGIVEFGGTSRFRSWNFGNQPNQDETIAGEVGAYPCETTDPVPCYDRDQYLGPDNLRGTADDSAPLSSAAGAAGASATFASGFLPRDGDPDTDINADPNVNKLRAIAATLGGENGGTKTFLAMKQAKSIMDATDGRSKVIILMSDGVSTDCCSGGWAVNQCGTTAGGIPLIERNHCSEVASCVGPAPECNVGFGQVQDLDCENITCAGVTEFRCVGGPDSGSPCTTPADCRPITTEAFCEFGICDNGPDDGNACETAADCRTGVDSAGCMEQGANCCSLGPVSCNPTGGGLNDCQFSDPEAATMNSLGDDIYVFTVSFPNVIPPMERWADNDPNGQIDFSYAGNNALQMFDNILSNIGVRVQISNNETFSDAGAANWVDETTIAEPDFAVPLLTPELNQHCTDTWQRVFVRTIYGGTGANAYVTLSEPRWNYCPRVSF